MEMKEHGQQVGQKEDEFEIHWKDEENEGKSLVGKIVSQGHIGIGAMKDCVKAAWKVKGDLDIKDIGTNMYDFTFGDVYEMQRILDDSLWTIKSHILSLCRRLPFVSNGEIQISTFPFWVQLHDIPSAGLCTKNVRFIARKVEKVLEAEDLKGATGKKRSFCRARVEVDIEKPLVMGFNVVRPREMDKVWVYVKNEKLLKYCFKCGRLGHDIKNCDFNDGNGGESSEGRKYGIHLFAPAIRTMKDNFPAILTSEGRANGVPTSRGEVVHG